MPVPSARDRAADLTGHWLAQDFLELGALPGAVPSARLHARHILWEWALTCVRDQLELVVSELVTNAVQASRATRLASAVQLWLLRGPGRVAVLVWDASPLPPVRMDSRADAEEGRGLHLVQAASAQWGWYFPVDNGGKVVWAIVQ